MNGSETGLKHSLSNCGLVPLFLMLYHTMISLLSKSIKYSLYKIPFKFNSLVNSDQNKNATLSEYSDRVLFFLYLLSLSKSSSNFCRIVHNNLPLLIKHSLLDQLPSSLSCTTRIIMKMKSHPDHSTSTTITTITTTSTNYKCLEITFRDHQALKCVSNFEQWLFMSLITAKKKHLLTLHLFLLLLSFLFLFIIIIHVVQAQVPSPLPSRGLAYCAVANTSILPLTSSLLKEQQQRDGILCPFGFIKQTQVMATTISFQCVSVLQLLNEIVDQKDCFIPDGETEANLSPILDPQNCLFDFLHCSPRTRKCTFTNTRAQGDVCVDRLNCIGSSGTNTNIQRALAVNCHEGRCTSLQNSPSLPIGSSCWSASSLSSSEYAPFLNYQNNTLLTCVENSICTSNGNQLPRSYCIQLQSKRASTFESCGAVSKDRIQDMSYKLCKEGLTCQSQYMKPNTCAEFIKASDFEDLYRFPFNYHLSIPTLVCPDGYKDSSTFMGDRIICQKNGTDICLTNAPCGGYDLFNIKSSYSFKSGRPRPLSKQFDRLTKCDTSTQKCVRVFGKENGMNCSDHSECRSSYCFNNTYCTNIPKEIPCGPSVANPTLYDCPGYSHCICTNSTRGICANLCFAELADFHTCAYNVGVFGETSPVSVMENTLFPFVDNASSVFSLENGTCKDYMVKYFECMQSVQQGLQLEILPIVVVSQNGDTEKTASTTPQPDDAYFFRVQQVPSSLEQPLFIVNINESYQTAISRLEPNTIQLTTIDMFLNLSQTLMQVSPLYTNVRTSDYVIISTTERMVGLMPRYKFKTVDFKNIHACACCTEAVTKYLEASLDGGILLRSNRVNVASAIYINNVDLSITITGLEPIMGHNSFLNRNWYERCDIILVPPQDIDAVTLSIKNNMLLLDNNGTSIIKELESASMNDLFVIFISNLPSKVLAIPRDVRDAAMTNQPLFIKISELVREAISQKYNQAMQLYNSSQANGTGTNSTRVDCSLFNSTLDVRAYHRIIFSFPLTFDLFYPLPLSSSSFIIEFDQWFSMNELKKYGNSLEEQAMKLLDILVDPMCYSNYNSYLGVFHYKDTSKYWDLILKDSMLWVVMASSLSFYAWLFSSYRNSVSLKRRLFTPFIGPFCMMIICLMYIEPILMSLFKTIGRNIIPLIPIPDLFMSLLTASYIVVLIRFYFLRNLYQIRKGLEILKGNKMNNMRIYRMIAKPYVALVLMIFVAILLFGIWFGVFYGIMESIIIERFRRFEWTLQFDASLLALTTQFGFLSLVSIICLTLDALFNLKKIRKHVSIQLHTSIQFLDCRRSSPCFYTYFE